MRRILFVAYGLLSYVLFLLVYVYFALWENNILVPTGIDVGEQVPVLPALIINVALIALFFIPHSLMARKSFKEWWTKIIPPEIERSTYVLVSSILMIIWIFFWQPIPVMLYDFSGSWLGTALTVLSFAGFIMVVFCTFLINHFDLLGLKQVYLAFKNQKGRAYQFVTPFLYKLVRHPLYLGFMIAFWIGPVFTLGHLVFAAVSTAFTLRGIRYEEKDLKEEFGQSYEQYAQDTPMLFPSIVRSKAIAFILFLIMFSLGVGYSIGPMVL